MDLDSYLKTGVPAVDLARAIGAPVVSVSQWRTGARRVPVGRCPAIEKATHGAVRCEDLRPDVDWAYLRGCHCAVDQQAA